MSGVSDTTPLFGVHTGPSNTTLDELTALWRRIEDGPFDWISIWDHFYSSDGTETHCFEAVAIHTALAAVTERVRCACLVYCAAYRHPAVLANAMATIDHISGGRCDVGLGAGWAQFEFDAYGIAFESAKIRLDVMNESARCVKGLLQNERFDFEGEHFRFVDAACDPRPIQSALPVWIGGGGERRTLRIVAEVADGWNVPFIAPEDFARKREVLGEHCSAVGRDIDDISCTINVGCAPTEAALRRQFGVTAEFVRPGVLMGTTEQIVDRLGQYIESGADQINLALRAPFEYEALDAVADAIADF
jgi:alkanesulfonate monooxygenase SsuD/methylene tetrahydromethanopterin reductase-like flavin-dependent oxidoreductase (luciferase family)